MMDAFPVQFEPAADVRGRIEGFDELDVRIAGVEIRELDPRGVECVALDDPYPRRA
jgi:hypothetical protein